MFQEYNIHESQHQHDIAHDRKLIEDSFHSGIAPKAEIEKIFKKYGSKK